MTIETRVRRKTTRWILLPLLVLTFIGSLDRVNLSFAALQMGRELGIDAKAYGLSAGIFFASYILCQLPSVALLARVGTRRWLTVTILMWGILSLAMAFTRSLPELLVLRLLLGIAEAGFAPGIIYIMSQWTPPQFRGRAFATPMLAVPASVVIGGPLCGWLVEATNPIGFSGWRWMFLVLGIATICCSILSLRVIPDRPADAPWLNEEERHWLSEELCKSQAAKSRSDTGAGKTWNALVPTVFACVTYFALLGGTYGITFWLPQAVEHLSHSSTLVAGCVTALPWLGLGAGIFWASRRSDATGSRFPFVITGGLIGALGMASVGFLGVSPGALAGLIASGIGLGIVQGVFWTLPPHFLSEAKLRTGVPIINSCGSLSGFVVPLVIGTLRQRTGGFDIPIFALAALIGLIAVAASLMLVAVRMSRLTVPGAAFSAAKTAQ